MYFRAIIIGIDSHRSIRSINDVISHHKDIVCGEEWHLGKSRFAETKRFRGRGVGFRANFPLSRKEEPRQRLCTRIDESRKQSNHTRLYGCTNSWVPGLQLFRILFSFLSSGAIVRFSYCSWIAIQYTDTNLTNDVAILLPEKYISIPKWGS